MLKRRFSTLLIVAGCSMSLFAGTIANAQEPVDRGAILVRNAAPQKGAQERSKQPVVTQQQAIEYLGRTSPTIRTRIAFEALKNKTYGHWYGNQGNYPEGNEGASTAFDRVLMWHDVLLDTVALDHTPDPDTNIAPLDNLGPCRTSRALAIVMISIFDAVNAFEMNYQPYNEIDAPGKGASIDIAIAVAAHRTLRELFPSQRERLINIFRDDIAEIGSTGPAVNAGRIVGQNSANAILGLRADDNSNDPEPNWGEGGRVADGKTTSSGNGVNDGVMGPFQWSPDPTGTGSLCLGAFWGGVTPFFLDGGDQFRVPPAPEPGSLDYLIGYLLVRYLGAHPDIDGSLSTPETQFVGNYWGYDAVPLLCAPPRLYNQIVAEVAVAQGVDQADDIARILALSSSVQADCGIAAWDSKYYYNYWRPVTGIREDDGDSITPTVPGWTPFGVSVINTDAPATATPPFPAHPSGHATFGAGIFSILRHEFGDQGFTFVSDEYNGEGVDPAGVPRPLIPVRFSSYTEAQEENGMSRIFNGVHWQWDNVLAQDLGESIADYVLNEIDAFQPTK